MGIRSYTRYAEAMPKTPTTPLRIDRATWTEFGEAAAATGTDRSKLLREFIDWYLRRPGAKLPKRPDTTTD